MCGIAGILKVHPPGTAPPPPEVAIPETWLDILDESIRHRGPDGQGRFRDRATRPDGSVVDVAFVHRRLAIIDLADGQQPMVSERGPGFPERERSHRVAVVFNGCIYNHRGLRRELQAAGHEFVTDHSDTEVLIHGWREWGHKVFERLEGMFAITIWDASLGILCSARDFAGEKPLYEFRTSTINAISTSSAGLEKFASSLRLGPADQKVRANRSTRWLAFGFSVVDRQFDKGSIQELWPRYFTHPVRTQSGMGPPLSRVMWDELPARLNDSERRPEQIEELIRESVHSQLEADVPLGCFLSGGIDSGLITAIATEKRPDIRTFTMQMPDESFDESAAARATARHLGVEHHVLEVAASPAEDLVALIHQIGLPLGDSSLLPTTWLCRAARSYCKVALAGDGGDELFAGYERYRAARWIDRWKSPLSLPLLQLFENRSATSVGSRLARLSRAAAGAGYADLLAIFPLRIFQQLVSSFDATPAFEFKRTHDAPTDDFTGYLPYDLLRKTDSASMSVALEVRCPMLSRSLCKAALGIPLEVLMPNGERKGLLKAVARKYLPDEIVNRPKMGFSIPIGEWFRTDYGGMRQLLLDTLNSADPFPEDLLGIKINRQFVAKMVADHMDRKRDHSQRLYMLLVLAIWAEWLRTLNSK
jgi:asparagine synthase (glutamine-hydrolysing)